jgi:hypothetical protein
MKALVTRCLLMIVLVAVTLGVAQVVIPPDREDYLAIINWKVKHLEETRPPRIVFVGGSNLAFGIDSTEIEKALGTTVVNMGMGFNMGLRFMLDLVEPRIGKGDLVVLVPEYNLFYGLFDGDERLLDVLELYPEGWKLIHSRQQWKNLVMNSFRHVKFKLNRVLQQVGHEPDPACVYCPQAFNDHGDLTAHLGKPGKDVSKMAFLKNASREVDGEAIEVINAFASRLIARGARVVFLYPSIPQPDYDERKAAIDRLHAALTAKMKVPQLSTPEDFVYPAGEFYDWVYHLNAEGRQKRTRSIIADLRPAVEAMRAAAGPPAVAAAGQ